MRRVFHQAATITSVPNHTLLMVLSVIDVANGKCPIA